VAITVHLEGSGSNPIEIDVTNLPLDITVARPVEIMLDPVSITLAPITINPLDVSLRLKEVPSLRITFPVDYRVAFGLCGIELACIHFCGQSQIITEPYVPNPCECCGAIARG
jgi:hypothetical protein